jgi:two-component system, chemotaxis family, protein-glutamate methylesterase/glutaminase
MNRTAESVIDMPWRWRKSQKHGSNARLWVPSRPLPQADSTDRCDTDTDRRKVLVIGGADSDIAALQAVLTGLRQAPFAVVAAIELQPMFAANIISSLQRATGYRVKIAETGDCILPGQVLLLPAKAHLAFRGLHSSLTCELFPVTSNNDDLQTIDMLFASAAEVVGNKAIGLLLSGTGNRGRQGLMAMQQFRCLTAREIEIGKPRHASSKERTGRYCEAEQVQLAHVAGWILEAAKERPMDPPAQSMPSPPCT